MLFPIGDENIKGGHFPLFSYSLIVLNILVYILEVQQGDMLGQMFVDFGATPRDIVQGEKLYTLFTSIFLHGGIWHLLGNMLFLWIFADNIEATIGNFRFLFFYLMGGLAAHALHIYFNFGSGIPTIGASGAIAAVMGAYMIMYPTSRVKVLFIIFPFRVSAWIFLGLWIFMQFQSGIGEMALADGEGAGIAYWAHIGGFVFGVVMGFYYRFRYPQHRRYA